MTYGFVGQLFRAWRKVESLERNPAFIVEITQLGQNRFEIVGAPAAMAAVELVHVHMANQREVPLDQYGMRIGFVDGVVHVEHGLDRRTADLAPQIRRLSQRQ